MPGDGILANTSTPPPENGVGKVAGDAQSFVHVLEQTALNTAVQQPLDALAQFANKLWHPLTGDTLHVPQVFKPLPEAQFGSSTWAAEMIGMGLGRTADISAIALGLRTFGVTRATTNFLTRNLEEHPQLLRYSIPVLNSALPAGIYGMALVPSKSPGTYWKDRLINGGTWALGGAAAGGVGEYLSSAFRGWKVGQPGDSAAKLALKQKGSTAISWAAQGATGFLTKTMMYTALGERSLPLLHSPIPASIDNVGTT